VALLYPTLYVFVLVSDWFIAGLESGTFILALDFLAMIRIFYTFYFVTKSS
jgi:hypothetical protein